VAVGRGPAARHNCEAASHSACATSMRGGDAMGPHKAGKKYISPQLCLARFLFFFGFTFSAVSISYLFAPFVLFVHVSNSFLFGFMLFFVRFFDSLPS
jgi:hypothetical protein